MRITFSVPPPAAVPLAAAISIAAAIIASGLLLAQTSPPPPAPAAPPATDPGAPPGAYAESIPGSNVAFRMVPVPADGASPGGWIGACEVTWELFDLFVFGIDGDREREGDSVDAYTRPSKPYVPPDRGFGHEGYPVISASARSAREFCRWLSAKTGREYRLPTVEEWRRAAAAGSTGRWCGGDDPAALGEWAWYEANAGGTTHPVGRKRANGWGLHDVHGNAGEWASELADDGTPRFVLCGGSYDESAEGVATAALRRPAASWQMSDPQLPKSRWWLSDAPFAGLRVFRPAPATRSAEGGTEEPATPAPAAGSPPGAKEAPPGPGGAKEDP